MARIREERDRLEDKDAVRSEAERTGFEREVTWLEEQRQPCEKVMVAFQKAERSCLRVVCSSFRVWVAVRAVVVVCFFVCSNNRVQSFVACRLWCR